MKWELRYVDKIKESKVLESKYLDECDCDPDIKFLKYLQLYFTFTKEFKDKNYNEVLWID
jgi:hypothetical protein